MAGPYAVAYLCKQDGLVPPGCPGLLVTVSSQIHRIRQHLTELGLRDHEPKADRFALTRHCYRDPSSGLEIRIAFDRLETDVATLLLSERLALPGLTLRPSELLLSRLGWSMPVERYQQEAEALIERFEIVGDDEVEGINGYAFASTARSSVSMETAVTVQLDAIIGRRPPGDQVAERAQLLKVWMKSAARRPAGPNSGRKYTLYRNWIYPTLWM